MVERVENSEKLEIVERILRNLPILSPEMHFRDTPYGRLYFGFGLDVEGRYHGVWGFTRGPGMARTITFEPNQPKFLVVREFIEDGTLMMEQMHAKGMFDEGYWQNAG